MIKSTTTYRERKKFSGLSVIVSTALAILDGCIASRLSVPSISFFSKCVTFQVRLDRCVERGEKNECLALIPPPVTGSDKGHDSNAWVSTGIDSAMHLSISIFSPLEATLDASTLVECCHWW